MSRRGRPSVICEVARRASCSSSDPKRGGCTGRATTRKDRIRYRAIFARHVSTEMFGVQSMSLPNSTNGIHNVDQGYFAEGFVASIAAAAGLDVHWPRLGHRTDFGVFLPGPNGTSGSKQINLQVKSWSTGSLDVDNHFHYPLRVSAYNYLAGSNHDVRHYLVLCRVPPRAADYADAQHDRLRLQHAAYWLSLRDQVPDESLDPGSTKTVLVPATQLLTVVTLRALVEGEDQLAVVP